VQPAALPLRPLHLRPSNVKATLFVLLPAAASRDMLVASAPSALQASLARMRTREYPQVADARELEYQLRLVQDQAATTGHARRMRVLLGGAGLGAASALLCAQFLGTRGGDLERAVPLGLAVGATLAAIKAPDSIRIHPLLTPLLAQVRPGSTLVSWTGRDRLGLEALRDHCAAAGVPTALRA